MGADLRLRQVGESYRDYAARMAGAARAAELDAESLRVKNGLLHATIDAAYQLGYRAGVDESRAGIALD